MRELTRYMNPKYREIVHANQIKSGVIPPASKLTARPEQIPAWDSHSAEHRKLFARHAENYADFLEACGGPVKPPS